MQIVVYCASQLVTFFVINLVSLNTSLLTISAPLSVGQSLAYVLVPLLSSFLWLDRYDHNSTFDVFLLSPAFIWNVSLYIL